MDAFCGDLGLWCQHKAEKQHWMNCTKCTLAQAKWKL